MSKKSLIDNQYFNLAEIIPLDQNCWPLSDQDPQPPLIDSNISGPFHIYPGVIICDQCGNMIRENYLSKHRSTGACQRNIERQASKTGQTPDSEPVSPNEHLNSDELSNERSLLSRPI